MKSMWLFLHIRAHDSDSIAQKEVTCDKTDENDSLNHFWHTRRLDLASCQQQRAEQHRNEDNRNWIQLCQPCHNNASEAISCCNRGCLQTMNHPCHFTHATQTRQRTRKHHHKYCIASDADASILRSTGIVTD